MSSIKRFAGAGSAAVLLALSLSACGDSASDAPDDASVEDFCKAYNATSSSDEDASDSDKVDEAHEQAEKLIEVGTPEDISDDAREGFEILVDAVADIEEDDVDNINNAESEDAFRDAIGASEDDFEKVVAFLTYAGETCAEAPAE
jgi:hypothetical protein